MTIDQINRIEGIPRSTVGYYVRKFNKKGMSRGVHKVPQNLESKNVKLQNVQLALFFLDILPKMINEEKFREVKDIIEAYFALEKFIRNLTENVGGGKHAKIITIHVFKKFGLENIDETAKLLLEMDLITKHTEYSAKG